MAERFFEFEPDLPLLLGRVQPRGLDPRLARSEIVRSHLANRIDPYIGCASDCPYCITREFIRLRGPSWGLPSWWLDDLDENWRTPIVRPGFVERLEDELDSINVVLPLVRIGNYTDAYQPIEKELKLTRQVLALLLEKAPETRVVVRSPANKARKKLIQNAVRRGIIAGVALDPWTLGVNPIRVVKQFTPRPAYCFIGGLLDRNGAFPHLDFYERELPRVIRWMLEHNVPHEIEPSLESALGLDGYSDSLLPPEAVYEWLEEHGERL